MTAGNLHDLAAIAGDLAGSGRLAQVRSEVDLRHELAGIARRMDGAPHAVSFEAVGGHRTAVVTGLYWNRGLLAHLLRADEASLLERVAACFAQSRAERFAPHATTGELHTRAWLPPAEPGALKNAHFTPNRSAT